MIRNLTQAEWGALIDAYNLLDQEYEQNPENYTGQHPSVGQRRRTLHSAFDKVRQLAPATNAR